MGCKFEVPTTPSSDPINLLARLTELRETLRLTSLLKELGKDADEKADISQMKRYTERGVGGSRGAGVHHLPGYGCAHQSGSAPNTVLLGFYGGLLT